MYASNIYQSPLTRMSHLTHNLSDLLVTHEVVQVYLDCAQRKVQIEPFQVHSSGVAQNDVYVSAEVVYGHLERTRAAQFVRVAQYTGYIVMARRVDLGD